MDPKPGEAKAAMAETPAKAEVESPAKAGSIRLEPSKAPGALGNTLQVITYTVFFS